jgi:Na+-transporting methylmalonyl-CoA/oxaloacetate decarboxylase gamma subunit
MDWSFGLTMMFMGMAVTLLTLYLLSLIIRLMIKFFPYQAEEKPREAA